MLYILWYIYKSVWYGHGNICSLVGVCGVCVYVCYVMCVECVCLCVYEWYKSYICVVCVYYVCVVCVCAVCEREHKHKYVCTLEGQKLAFGVFLWWTGPLPESRAHRLAMAAVRALRKSICLCPPLYFPSLRAGVLEPVLPSGLLSADNLNSGLLACMTGTSPSEPSLQPPSLADQI